MKKAIVILLLFFYLIPAIGVSISVHYCCGKLASVSLTYDQVGNCACGKKALKRKCCKTKNTIVKLKDVQKNSSQIILKSFKELKGQPALCSKQLLAYQNPTLFLADNVYPPPLSQTGKPLYLRLRVFRI